MHIENDMLNRGTWILDVSEAVQSLHKNKSYSSNIIFSVYVLKQEKTRMIGNMASKDSSSLWEIQLIAWV